MAKKSVIASIYTDLVTSMKTVVGAKYIFLKDRPKTKDEDSPMAKFAVIDLPIGIDDYVIGNKKTMLTTSGVFYLFVQSRNNGTLDVNATGDFADDVVALFPIKGECCSAANPVVRMTGNDGQGFQVVTISFDLLTKWKVFE
jgi:hypothetical protein